MTLTTMPPATSPNTYLKFTDGDINAEVLILSEYFTAEEAHHGRPLIGSSGYEFKKICVEAGLVYSNTLRAVCTPVRPLGGDIRDLLYPTSEKKTRTNIRGLYPKPPLLQSEDRILTLIQNMPNLKLIIGLGSLPLWLLTDCYSVATTQGYKVPTGASKWRGSQLFTSARTGVKIPYLPLIHPVTIMRDWSSRFPTVHDIKSRAVRFLNGKLSWEREPWDYNASPTFEEASISLHRLEARLSLGPVDLAVDIETWRRKYIACIGIADNAFALCIPFFHFDEKGNFVDYFTSEQEIEIWLQLRRILAHPNCRIIGQNFIYDTQFLHRQYFITPSFDFDTMLAHHLLWPGTPKSLDYLASLYCHHYVYWKDESQDWDGQFEHKSLWVYNCKDVRETYDIAIELKDLLEKMKMKDQWEFQKEQWLLAFEMMTTGVAVNRNHFKQINSELTAIAEELEEFLLKAMPIDIRYTSAGGPWFSSPKHQMMIFYDQLGLKPVKHKKTKQPTFDVTALATLKETVPWLSSLFQALEDYRSIGVFRSHFLEMQLSFDGRLRCNFNVGGTETFRWSSSANGFGEGTNFQNIPKGDD